MQTRKSDLSSVSAIKRFIENFSIEIQKYNRTKNALTDIQRIDSVNAQMLCVIQHMNLLLQVSRTNAHNFYSVERFFQTCLNRKKLFTLEMEKFSKKPENNTVRFQTKSNQLMNKLKKISNKIHDYYNRKCIVILMKTNSDIYRLIMSYL